MALYSQLNDLGKFSTPRTPLTDMNHMALDTRNSYNAPVQSNMTNQGFNTQLQYLQESHNNDPQNTVRAWL